MSAMEFVERRGPDECWPWLKAHDPLGYGKYRPWIDGKIRERVSHRAVYEEMVGPIPAGLVIDHLCHNRGCQNPAHMEPVTNAENVRRGFIARGYEAKPSLPPKNPRPDKSPTCSRGHLYDYEWQGRRQCKTCNRERQRLRRIRHRAGQVAA